MKYKKILIYMLVFALMFSPVSVRAEMEGNTASTEWGDSLEPEEDLPDAVVDEGGWYSEGVANISFFDVGYDVTRYWNFTITGSKLYVIYDSSDTSYAVCTSSENSLVSNSHSTSSGDSGYWTNPFYPTRTLVNSNGGFNTNIIFNTNLPVFSFGDNESINAYLNNGDITGASNYEDLLPDEEIVVPKVENLKITSGFYEGSRKENVWQFTTPISVEWSVDDTTDLRYQVQYRCVFYVLDEGKNPSSGLKTVTSDWIDDVRGLPIAYADKTAPYSYKVSANKLESIRGECQASVFNDSVVKEKLKKAFLNFTDSISNPFDDDNFTVSDLVGLVDADYFFANHCVQIRVRNYIGDAFGSGTYGDWTTVVLDYDDNSSSGYTGDIDDEDGSTEEVDWESDGRVDEDDSQPTTEIDWDSDSDGDVGLLDLINTIIKLIGNVLKTITTAITTFVNFIMSGFGLLGDNGLLAFFTSFFSFIPKELWTLIGTAVSLSIVLMVIRFFKK